MVENPDLDDELIKSILNEYKVRNVDICIKYTPTPPESGHSKMHPPPQPQPQ